MPFKPGDTVYHKSDVLRKNPMVVVCQAKKEYPPSNPHNEAANIGAVTEGYYYCTWIYKDKKCGDYFSEDELML